MSAPQTSFWEMRSFSLAHRRGSGWLLENVDLTVPRGGLYLLVGASGGGKSSLMRLSAGLLEEREPAPHTQGQFICLGEPVHQGLPSTLRHRVAAVLQEEGLLDELTPRENVELALRTAGRSRKLAPALLAQAGLDPAPTQTARLSGGQRKRLAVARALASEPEVLFCDEPTAGLDPAAARAIAELLRESHTRRPGTTMVVITHDAHAFRGLTDGVLVLDREQRTLRLASEASAPTDHGSRVKPERSSDADEVLHGVQRQLLRLSSIGETLAQSILRLPPVEVGQTARTVLQCMLLPLPFVVAGSAVIGGLATFFALRNNPVQGAFERDLLAGTGKVLIAVLVPLLAGFFFTARVAAGATARLGTMKRTQQVSALSMIGIRPADYLLTPLVWGMVLALPFVTMVGCVAASLGAMLATEVAAGLHEESWAAAFFRNLDATDARIVVAKAALSGYLVAVTCYHLGIGPKRSGGEVGDAVNRAIVVGMSMVLAVHAVFTFVLYS
jgi:ABC-type multidrug transport system ATPase subunit/ABC-type transporter Mla maintaining outer membrane lipid asymmetry permease subunit MlaE